MDDSQRFDAYLKAPSVWFYEGIGLLRAAFLLWERFSEEFENSRKSAGGELSSDQLVSLITSRFIQSYMLLAGLAIENCVKAVIVAKGQPKFTKGDLPKELKSHDLCKLFSCVGIDLSEADVLLVSRSAEAITWKGRYAVPRRASEISGDGFARFFNHPRDIVGLFRKMAEHLPPKVLATDWVPDIEPYLNLLDRECPKTMRSPEKGSVKEADPD